MHSRNISRRSFLEKSTITSAAVLAAPAVVTAQKTDSQVIIGDGEYKYEVLQNWAKLPDRYTWQTSHNVAVDKANNLYVIHEGKSNQKEHPSIFVFDAKGKFIRAFGKEFQGGGHGLEVREENGTEFLYVTGYQHLKNFAKLSLTGEKVWEKRAPMESKFYAEGEDVKPRKKWGRNRFMPTNYAFHPDGGFYLADGYGAWRIHRYDQNAKWMSSFGGPGKGDGQFNLPHGLWIDNRPDRKPSVVVADRANARLQWFSLTGQHQKTLDGFILPANVDTYQDLMLVPDLSARITLLDKDDKLIHLGEDPEWRKVVKGQNIRSKPNLWKAGKWVHPHDACFDQNGDIIVAEWVATGRVTKLKRLS